MRLLFSPSWFVSKAHDKYQLSRDFSRASRSYFSNVRLSTMPVNDMICPPIVDLPASTKHQQSALDNIRWFTQLTNMTDEHNIHVLLLAAIFFDFRRFLLGGCFWQWIAFVPIAIFNVHFLITEGETVRRNLSFRANIYLPPHQRRVSGLFPPHPKCLTARSQWLATTRSD